MQITTFPICRSWGIHFVNYKWLIMPRFVYSIDNKTVKHFWKDSADGWKKMYVFVFSRKLFSLLCENCCESENWCEIFRVHEQDSVSKCSLFHIKFFFVRTLAKKTLRCVTFLWTDSLLTGLYKRFTNCESCFEPPRSWIAPKGKNRILHNISVFFSLSKYSATW
jgi:hypothetical protein